MLDSGSKPKVAVLDYGMGNLCSVVKAWERAGAEAVLASDLSVAKSADALVFPGQGAIVDCMRQLAAGGMDSLIRDWVEADKPFFGICLGLQALFESSEEGDAACLGILPGAVKRFEFSLGSGFKVPHMGWNDVEFRTDSGDPLLDGIGPKGSQFYFVHSYFVEATEANEVFGVTEYGGQIFCSAVRRGRLVATQFHPEKSQALGLNLYRNFLGTL